jgi:hypothetical protein
MSTRFFQLQSVLQNCPQRLGKYQTIPYYSALNGHRFGVISVLAEEGMPDQELEGNCYASVTAPGGHASADPDLV